MASFLRSGTAGGAPPPPPAGLRSLASTLLLAGRNWGHAKAQVLAAVVRRDPVAVRRPAEPGAGRAPWARRALSSFYDTRRREPLGRRHKYTFKLDKLQPTILALTRANLSAPTIGAPAAAARGSLLEIPVQVRGESAGTAHALRVRVLAPDGKELRMLARTLAAPGGKAVWQLPLAVNAPEGRYTLEAIDIATGAKSTEVLTVR